MHPSRLARIIAAAMLAAFPAPTGPSSSSDERDDAPDRQVVVRRSSSPTRCRASRRTARRCASRLPRSAPPSDRCRLWRKLVNGGDRRLIATVAGDARCCATRTGISGRQQAYRCFVSGVNAEGTRVARSEIRKVYVGRPAEVLRFNCIVRDATRASRRWSVAGRTRPGPLRSGTCSTARSTVGAREAMYRHRRGRAQAFRDRDVKPGQAVRYAVVALNASGTDRRLMAGLIGK